MIVVRVYSEHALVAIHIETIVRIRVDLTTEVSNAFFLLFQLFHPFSLCECVGGGGDGNRCQNEEVFLTERKT